MNRHQQTNLLNFATVVLLVAVPGSAYFLLTDQAPVESPKRNRAAIEPIVIPKTVETEFTPYYAKYLFQEPVAPQPKTAASEKPKATPSVTPPNFQVVAMVQSSETKASLITVKQGNVSSVMRIGDQKDGYTFNSIDAAGKASFEKQGKTFLLEVSR